MVAGIGRIEAARLRIRRIVVVSICLFEAVVQLFTGPRYQGPFRPFVTGYAIDILLPFSAYFLLTMCDGIMPALRLWPLRAAVVFAVISSAEVAQYFGRPIFGKTYDPLDFVAYAGGTALAVLADRFVLPRMFKSWALTG